MLPLNRDVNTFIVWVNLSTAARFLVTLSAPHPCLATGASRLSLKDPGKDRGLTSSIVESSNYVLTGVVVRSLKAD